ncbi:MAG: methyltransferase [Kiritimatiellia bacterium]|jgi:putative N6-adenine-specific DNA methylase|nr:methyltransferase [Kiritimatiellia bacterium]
MSEIFELFAAAIPGTERALHDELRELGFSSVRLNRGGIPFRGPLEDGWRACLESRISTRIQAMMLRFPAPDQDALYDGVRKVDWTPYISHKTTISVSSVCNASSINHSGFAALKTKDAIVDQIRAKGGRRPSVAKDDPDVRVFLYILKDRAAVYLDMSGDALHRRGYRVQTGEAPLKETLASAMLRLSGWDRKTPLIDPMCGSGTIAIEAAQWAANIAPGLARERFGFERWANFGKEEEQLMRELRGKLRSSVMGQVPRIVAGDIDADVLEIAKKNARSARVKLAFKHRALEDMQVSDHYTTIVTNPPYDARMDADLEYCRGITTAFSRLHGWRVALLAGSPDYEKTMSIEPALKIRIPNGDIKCDFLVYDVE